MEESHQVDMWAIVELMGHGMTAGIIKTSDLGGLLRVDVPMEDGYRTEYYGENAIYSIKIVSEEIARVYARPERNVIAYDEPIVPRAQYEEALNKARRQIGDMEHHIRVLNERLTTVRSLPEKTDSDEDERRHCHENNSRDSL